MLRVLLAFVMAAGCLSAQAIIQQSVAAAAGSMAGSVMGKKVSDALDKAMSTVEAATVESPMPAAQASEPAKPVSSTGGMRRAAVPPMPAGSPASSGGASGVPRAAAASSSSGWTTPAQAQIYGASRTYPQRPAVTPPAETSPEELTAIQAGVARKDLLTQLGTPAARVYLPVGGGLQEVYFYQSRGETVGTVRLMDGEVTGVQINQ